MSNDKEVGSSLGWFVAGAAIGAAAAILFAPKSGAETRQYLREATEDGRKAAEENGRDLMEKGKDLYERGRKIADDASELFDRGRKLVRF